MCVVGAREVDACCHCYEEEEVVVCAVEVEPPSCRESQPDSLISKFVHSKLLLFIESVFVVMEAMRLGQKWNRNVKLKGDSRPSFFHAPFLLLIHVFSFRSDYHCFSFVCCLQFVVLDKNFGQWGLLRRTLQRMLWTRRCEICEERGGAGCLQGLGGGTKGDQTQSEDHRHEEGRGSKDNDAILLSVKSQDGGRATDGNGIRRHTS